MTVSFWNWLLIRVHRFIRGFRIRLSPLSALCHPSSPTPAASRNPLLHRHARPHCGTCASAVTQCFVHLPMAHIMSLVADGEPQFRERFNRLRNATLPLVWTVLPWRALRLLPGTSTTFGPPRRAARWSEFRRQPGIVWRSVAAAHTDTLPSPFFCNDRDNSLALGRSVDWPEAGVAEIPDGRVLDEHAWVVGPHDTFLGDFCYTGLTRFSRVNHILKLHPPQPLPGRTLNLCSANAVTNFFHFVIDAITRTDLVRRAGYTWGDFDQILFPRFHSAITEEIITRAGIPRHKLVRIGRREQFVCKTLIQPSFPGPLACTPPWVLDFYRRLFPPAASPRTRRLYFPRRENRQPYNEAALARRLAAHGFETIDPENTSHLRDRLAEASHVVGVHGAGLANLVFCAPGTRVLELMPTEISAHYNRWFYYTLCASGRMPYGVVIGQSRRQRLTTFSPQPKTPFDINLDAFDRALAALLTPQP